MKYNTYLDEILIGMGMVVIVLSTVLNDNFLIPIGAAAIVIGSVGLEAKRIRDCIKKSCEER